MEDNYLNKTNHITDKIKNLEKELERIAISSEVSLKNIKKNNVDAFSYFETKKREFRNCNNMFI
jgi:hypothetical protein